MQVIISHVNADFDSLAAMVAAQKIYSSAKLVFSGSQNRNVRDFISLHGEVLNFIDSSQLDKKVIKRLIIVDTRIADRLGELEDFVYKPGIEIFTFDHHPPTKEDLKATEDFSEITGATTTILVKIIREKKIEISPFEATLFALGIHEDTGSLTYPTTTTDDAETIAYLMSKKANIYIINHFLSRVLTEEQHNLLNALLKSAHLVNVNGIDILFACAEAEGYIEGASVITYKLGDLENADVVFNFIKTKDRINIIGRSRINEVDAGRVLSRFEGGGHPQAASAVVKTRDVRKLEQVLIDELKSIVRKPIVAREIMSKPVRTIDSKTTIQEASKMMLRYGHTGLPVTDKGNLVGMISRRDLDKAVHHGLSHAPIKGFMSHQVITVSPDTALYEVQKLLVEEGIGRVPVVDNGETIGIVTRTDLLRALHGVDYVSEPLLLPEPSKYSRKEIIKRLESLLPKNVQEL
ncbi:MAG: CBS domain-containing protein, partial [Candidatus Subteraquimicrobiales bacterium]|nr:CBS domain-containing protein [Candidatus Subteraquimicrobiales bacterium]